MNIDDFISLIKTSPEKINFNDVIQLIDENYDFTETSFDNGTLTNNTGENNGSCKIFSFAKIHNLNKEQTLNLFGDYYRTDVLKDPSGNNHPNIRNFIITGWNEVCFSNNALTTK